MITRANTSEDIYHLMPLAMSFISNTKYKKYYDIDTLVSLGLEVINDPNKVIFFEKDKGFIVGLTTPFIFNRNLKVAAEIAWWVEPSERKTGIGAELLEAFEHWAKERECDLITMVTLNNDLGKYYKKKGYLLYERAYLKDIKWPQ